MQPSSRSGRCLVGIDLGPAEQTRAAGTSRLVAEQAKALARLDLPWDWLPLCETEASPLRELFAPQKPVIGGGGKVSLRSTFWTGPAWARAGCALGFATNGLVPWRGVPVVSNFFDANIFEFANTWVRTGRTHGLIILRILARLSIRRSRRLFILSDYGRARMASLFPRQAHKFVVVPCGLSVLPPRSLAPPAWARDLARPFVLNVGVFSDNKNQPRVLEAWQILQAENSAAPALVLIGSGDSGYLANRIHPAIARLPRPQEVRIPGRVPDAELAWAYANACAYLQPSFAEGFGLPVIEAMAAGCAVACSRSTSLPETAGEAALYFDPAQPGDIARAVVRLTADAALREELRTLGRARAALYTWERNARQVAAEIAAVLTEMKLLS